MLDAVLAGLLVLATLPSAPDGDAVAKHLAAEYAAQTRGSETFVVTTNSEIHGGPFHRSEQSEAVYELENGVPKHKRVRKIVKNGKLANADELERGSAAEEGPISRYGMNAPYVAAALADYTFAAPRQSGDVFLLDFVPNVRDTTHGSGTITYTANGHIVSVLYKPAVLPKEPSGVVLTMSVIEVAFGPVSPERWDVVKITRSFSGHQGPFGGRGLVISTYDAYHSYDAPAAAFAAIELAPGEPR